MKRPYLPIVLSVYIACVFLDFSVLRAEDVSSAPKPSVGATAMGTRTESPQVASSDPLALIVTKFEPEKDVQQIKEQNAALLPGEQADERASRHGQDYLDPRWNGYTGTKYRLEVENRTSYSVIVSLVDFPHLQLESDENQEAEADVPPISVSPMPIRIAPGAHQSFTVALRNKPNLHFVTATGVLAGQFEVEGKPQTFRQDFPALFINPSHMGLHCNYFVESKPKISLAAAVNSVSFSPKVPITCTNTTLGTVDVSFNADSDDFFLTNSGEQLLPAQKLRRWEKKGVNVAEEFTIYVGYVPQKKQSDDKATLLLTVNYGGTSRQSQLELEGKTSLRAVEWALSFPQGAFYNSAKKIIDLGPLHQNQLGETSASITVDVYPPYEWRNDDRKSFTASLDKPAQQSYNLETNSTTGATLAKKIKIFPKKDLVEGAQGEGQLTIDGSIVNTLDRKKQEDITLSFRLSFVVKKPAERKEAIIMGEMALGREIPIPGVVLPVFKTPPEVQVVKLHPSKGSEKQKARIRLNAGKTGFLFAVDETDSTQSYAAAIEYNVGSKENPDVYIWPLAALVYEVIEQPLTDYGEIFSGTIKTVQIPFVPKKDVYVARWTLRVDYPAADTTHWVRAGTWSGSLREGFLPPIEVELHSPEDSNLRGKVLKATVGVELTYTDGIRVRYEYPISAFVSNRRAWGLEAALSFGKAFSTIPSLPCTQTICNTDGTTQPYSRNDFVSQLKIGGFYAFLLPRYTLPKTYLEFRLGGMLTGLFGPNQVGFSITVNPAMVVFPGTQRLFALVLKPSLGYHITNQPQVTWYAPRPGEYNNSFITEDLSTQSGVVGGLDMQTLFNVGQLFKQPGVSSLFCGPGIAVSAKDGTQGIDLITGAIQIRSGATFTPPSVVVAGSLACEVRPGF